VFVFTIKNIKILTFYVIKAGFLVSVDNIPMEELLGSDCGKRSSEDSEDICSVSLDTVLDVNILC
jgi:hypothetical protein